MPEKFWMWPNVSRCRRTLNMPAGCDMVVMLLLLFFAMLFEAGFRWGFEVMARSYTMGWVSISNKFPMSMYI
jgi:hypothetical protein